MAEIPRAFYDFLLTVDEPAQEREFVIKVAKAFMLNDLSHHADMVGFDVADCVKGPWSFGSPHVCTCAPASLFQVQYQAEALRPL